MRVLKRNPWLFGLGVLLAVLVVYGGPAGAVVNQPATDEPGSIIIFPKVIANGTRDTLIQITNTSNMGASAHCFYFDATNNCQEDNFDVDLTPQQPIAWKVSTGRKTGESVASTTPPLGAGMFLGGVPKRTLFQGELKCIQVDGSGVPIMGNSLKGEATLETLSSGQLSEYNAVAIQALSNPAPQCVGGPKPGSACIGTADCCDISNNCGSCQVKLSLDGSTYNSCPKSLVLTQYSEGASDLFTTATVSTEITLVPCTEDIENDRPTVPTSPKASFSLSVVDEDEFPLSGGGSFTCWKNFHLTDADVGSIPGSPFATQFIKTRIVAGPSSGLVGVAEELHTLGSNPAGTAAVNLVVEGSHSGGDVITVPQNTGH